MPRSWLFSIFVAQVGTCAASSAVARVSRSHSTTSFTSFLELYCVKQNRNSAINGVVTNESASLNGPNYYGRHFYRIFQTKHKVSFILSRILPHSVIWAVFLLNLAALPAPFIFFLAFYSFPKSLRKVKRVILLPTIKATKRNCGKSYFSCNVQCCDTSCT